MKPSNILFQTVLTVLQGSSIFGNNAVLASNVAQTAHAALTTGPKTMINLINGTPYDWVLKNMHEYQMYCK